jgi:hypothetical protein
MHANVQYLKKESCSSTEELQSTGDVRTSVFLACWRPTATRTKPTKRPEATIYESCNVGAATSSIGAHLGLFGTAQGSTFTWMAHHMVSCTEHSARKP